jgi:hypothetical protein
MCGRNGAADSIEQAKDRFKAAWIAFSQAWRCEALAQAYALANHANRPDRGRG